MRNRPRIARLGGRAVAMAGVLALVFGIGALPAHADYDSGGGYTCGSLVVTQVTSSGQTEIEHEKGADYQGTTYYHGTLGTSQHFSGWTSITGWSVYTPGIIDSAQTYCSGIT